MDATAEVFCAICGKDVSPAAAHDLFCPACTAPLVPRVVEQKHEPEVPAPEIFLG